MKKILKLTGILTAGGVLFTGGYFIGSIKSKQAIGELVVTKDNNVYLALKNNDSLKKINKSNYVYLKVVREKNSLYNEQGGN